MSYGETSYDAGEVTTPDGITLKVKGYRSEYFDGVHTTEFPEPVEYRSFDIHFWTEGSFYEGGHWAVSGDITPEGTDIFVKSNHEFGKEVEEVAKERGIEVIGDHEMSSAYFYLRTLEDAKRLVDIIEEKDEDE